MRLFKSKDLAILPSLAAKGSSATVLNGNGIAFGGDCVDIDVVFAAARVGYLAVVHLVFLIFPDKIQSVEAVVAAVFSQTTDRTHVAPSFWKDSAVRKVAPERRADLSNQAFGFGRS